MSAKNLVDISSKPLVDVNGKTITKNDFIAWTSCGANCQGHQYDTELEGKVVRINRDSVRVKLTYNNGKTNPFEVNVPKRELNGYAEVCEPAPQVSP